MTPAQFGELERMLGLPLPSGFRDVVVDDDARSGPLSTEGPFTGQRPFLIWSLRARDEVRPAPWPREYLVVGQDGCGNSYLVDTREQTAPVYFHDHETSELLARAPSYAEFLRAAELSCDPGGDEAMEPESVAIARTERVSDSILDPIHLQEWTAIVASDPEFTMPADRFGVNPLTKEVVRFPRPGAAHWRGRGESDVVELLWGALVWTKPGREGIEKARTLAHALDAKLLLGWDFA